MALPDCVSEIRNALAVRHVYSRQQQVLVGVGVEVELGRGVVGKRHQSDLVAARSLIRPYRQRLYDCLNELDHQCVVGGSDTPRRVEGEHDIETVSGTD